MPRKPKQSDDDQGLPPMEPNPYPPKTPEGEHDVRHWAWEIQYANKYYRDCLDQGIEWRGYKQRVDGLRATAAELGIDMASLGTGKADALVFNLDDDVFDLTEAKIDRILAECYKMLDRSANAHLLELLNGGAPLSGGQKSRLKRVIDILEKLRLIQHFCRERRPNGGKLNALKTHAELAWTRMTGGVPHAIPQFSQATDNIFEWTWPMRVMLYCERSGAGGGPAEMEIWANYWLMAALAGKSRWQGSNGCIVMMPPGHGKTIFGVYFFLCELIRNPEQNLGILHHVQPDAAKRVLKMKETIDGSHATGRRFRALFGNVLDLDKRKSRAAGQFTLVRKSASKDPSCRASGINDAAQGRDIHLLWPDDIVDEKERYEERQRNDTYRALTGTWFQRLRGKGVFWLITCTPWHMDDAYHRLIGAGQKHASAPARQYVQGRDGQWVEAITVIRMKVGSEDGKDKFKPLWDRYDRDTLRQKHKVLGDSLYNCLYLMNPLPDEGRIVNRLTFALHEPDAERKNDDAQFERESIMVLSLDPTATTGKSSDYAGLCLIAINAVRREARVLDAWRVSMDQVVLCEQVVEICKNRRVDEIFVETVSGFHATADMLERTHRIPAEKIRRIPSKGTNKGVRLRACAAYFQTGVITFRGRVNEQNETVGLSEHQWMYDQILDFGVVSEDEAVDMITQVVMAYSADLGEPEGEVTSAVRGNRENGWRPRRGGESYLSKMFWAMKDKTDHEDVLYDEIEFINGV